MKEEKVGLDKSIETDDKIFEKLELGDLGGDFTVDSVFAGKVQNNETKQEPKKIEGVRKEINSNMLKKEILDELINWYESIFVGAETEDVYAFAKALKGIKVLKEAYINMPQEIEKDAPKMEERFKYRYTFSKLGRVDEKIAEGINDRYKESKTILHNIALDKDRKDYVEAVVALIKMGANTTLKDNDGKTPIDYIPENRINDVYQNLQNTLKRHKGKAVGLRVLRAMVEVEVSRYKDYSNLNKYFNDLEAFVKENFNKKTEEEMENILSIHIFNDENKYIRTEREKYFLDKIKRNTNKIECSQKFFKSNNLDFSGLAKKIQD